MELKEANDLKKILALPVEPFTEQEVSAILEATLKTMDVPFTKHQPVPKTILIDFFGTQKSMKTTVTGKIEQVFRRHQFKAYCPPETAEHEGIRSLTTDNPIVEQAKHLNGVECQLLYLSKHPCFHLAITSRGAIDMLYWYEKGRRKGIYSDIHVQSVNNRVYELLRQDMVDAFLFFTCSVETAMRREYDGALTKRTGSKMNERDIAETMSIYTKVLEDAQVHVSGLPIHHVDTSEMTLRQAGEEVLRFILPTICNRFQVPEWRFMPQAPSLIQKKARTSLYFEEQLKFRGHPTAKRLAKADWNFVRESNQQDTYISVNQGGVFDPFGEAHRLRQEANSSIKFMYKSEHRDRMLSHRRPVTFDISHEESTNILKTYKTIVIISKNREHYQKDGAIGENHFFSLHVDTIEGLGNYTEIRARGSLDKTHTSELLALAQELGLSIDSMIEGSYLSLVLNNKK